MGHGQIQITVLFLWGFNPTEASTATDMQKKLSISWLIWGSEQQLMHNVVLNAWWIIRIQFQETPSLSTCRGGGRTSLAFAWWALHMRHFSFQSLIWSSLLWLEVVTYIPLASGGRWRSLSLWRRFSDFTRDGMAHVSNPGCHASFLHASTCF